MGVNSPLKFNLSRLLCPTQIRVLVLIVIRTWVGTCWKDASPRSGGSLLHPFSLSAALPRVLRAPGPTSLPHSLVAWALENYFEWFPTRLTVETASARRWPGVWGRLSCKWIPFKQLPLYRWTWKGDDVDGPWGGGRLQYWTPEQGGGLSIHMTISFFRSHKGHMVKNFICTYSCTWT